jgi:hypothetical protein
MAVVAAEPSPATIVSRRDAAKKTECFLIVRLEGGRTPTAEPPSFRRLEDSRDDRGMGPLPFLRHRTISGTMNLE